MDKHGPAWGADTMTRTRAALLAVGVADVLYRRYVRPIVRRELGIGHLSNAEIDARLGVGR